MKKGTNRQEIKYTNKNKIKEWYFNISERKFL